MWRFAFFAWLPLPVLCVLSGVLRQLPLTPHLGEPAACPLSGLSLSLLIAAYVVLLGRRRRLAPGPTRATGGLWLVLTVAFELLLGYYAAGDSWSRLLANYDITSGNLWLLDVVWVAAAPRSLLSGRAPAAGSR